MVLNRFSILFLLAALLGLVTACANDVAVASLVPAGKPGLVYFFTEN